MTGDAYEQLANALDRLPNAFPRTQSGVEIVILKRLMSEEEAFLASNLGRRFEPSDKLAERLGLPEDETQRKFKTMAERGIVFTLERKGKSWFRLAPFVVGIYELRGLDEMDHELAHLVDTYFEEGGNAGIMGPLPAIHRVLPSHGSTGNELILPYDDVKAILQTQKTFSVRKCICRVKQDKIGRKCTFPLDICLTFSTRERPKREGDISKDEALALLDTAEDLGLVHTVSNVMKGLRYVCNCCGCCCGILKGYTSGHKGALARSSYYSEIDKDTCSGCGLCVERCQVKAVSLEGVTATVDRGRCIGCGLCATKCPTGSARLFRKPEEEIVVPSTDTEAWEEERLKNRGLQI